MDHDLLATAVLSNLQDTDRLGKALAKHLPAQATIGLVGTLGAGKTRLVQSLATHAGVPERSVTSPTFTLIQPYNGSRRKICHIDAYRIADEDEYLELGIEELCETESLVLMEWADRFAGLLPPETLWTRMQVDSETTRTVEFFGLARVWESIVAHVTAEIATGRTGV